MDELRGQAAPSRASQGRGPESPRGALPSGPVPPSGPGVGPGRRPGERGGLLPEGAGGPGAERPQCRGGAAGPLGTALTPRPSGSPLESVFAIAYRRCRGTDRARTNMSDSDLCEGYQITKQNCAWMAGGGACVEVRAETWHERTTCSRMGEGGRGCGGLLPGIGGFPPTGRGCALRHDRRGLRAGHAALQRCGVVVRAPDFRRGSGDCSGASSRPRSLAAPGRMESAPPRCRCMRLAKFTAAELCTSSLREGIEILSSTVRLHWILGLASGPDSHRRHPAGSQSESQKAPSAVASRG